MKSDFMVAIHQVCHERQLPLDTVLEAVEVALISAYKRNYSGNHSITAQISPKTGEPQIFVEKAVVENVEDENNEISLAEAQTLNPQAELRGLVSIESTPKDFGRIAAQTAKQVILQRIREAERDALYRNYAEREGEIINGTVHKVDPHQVILSLGNVEATLPRSEQIPTERYSEGQRLRAYVSSVVKSNRGPQIIISRTHRTMLRRLLEVEVPEIYNGTVEIKSIAREAGYRSKVAVAALQEGVDPVGSCVGMRGTRIQNIVNELGGEKIDVVQWNPDIGYFIANSLSPAKVTNVMLYDEKGKTAVVVVPDKQLSLAIGKEGQNARLAAKLTGWRIDIKSVHEAVVEALEKIKQQAEIRDRVAHRVEIFNMSESVIAEKDPLNYTEAELKLLSEAIEVVNIAEMAVRREQKAKTLAEIKAVKKEKGDFDLLAHAEALLRAKGSTEQETTDFVETFEADLMDAVAELQADEQGTEGVATEIDALALELLTEVSSEKAADTQPEPVGEQPEAVTDEETIAEEVAEKSINLMAETETDLEEEEPSPKKSKAGWWEEDDEEYPDYDEDEERRKAKEKARRKKRRLVYNEELGEVVAERRRKRSRRDQNWLDYDEDL